MGDIAPSPPAAAAARCRPAAAVAVYTRKARDRLARLCNRLEAPLHQAAAYARRYVTRPTYYELFTMYMTVTVLAFWGFLLWAARGRLSVVDALFLAMSTFGNAGLTPVPLNTQPTAVKLVLAVLSIAGSTILGSFAPVLIRRYYIRRQLRPVERARLVEYSALGKLEVLVPAFLLAAHVGVFVALAFWLAATPAARAILLANNTTVAGFAAFLAVSSVENLGLTPTANSLESFRAYWFPLSVISLGVLAGMTFYPILLRGLVWLLYHLSSGYDRTVYRFLLRHPRRCYVHLFPSAETLWLLATAVAIPLIQFIFSAALDWADSPAFAGLDGGQKLINSMFIATVTRTGGFTTLPVAEFNPGMQVLLVGFMYLAVLPVIVAVRYSDPSLNPIRETSGRSVLVPLHFEADMIPAPDLKGGNTVRNQAKYFLTQNAIWVFSVWALVCIIQAGNIERDPDFSVFAVLFEVVSAYGCVGLSLGHAGTTASFSAVWSPGAKVLLATVIFVGRLRYMPFSVDRAVAFRRGKRRATATAFRIRVPASQRRLTSDWLGDASRGRRGPPAAPSQGRRGPSYHVYTTRPELRDDESVRPGDVDVVLQPGPPATATQQPP